MAEKLRVSEIYHLSKDVLLKTETDGAEFSVATGTPLKYLNKKKTVKGTFLLFHVRDGFLNISLPENKIQDYIHDSVQEAVRSAR